jgi:hypothetical protein
VIALPPIRFDRASGALEGENLWKRMAALALATGSKISSHFSHGREGHGNDPAHTVSRYILEKTPLRLIVCVPRSNRMETVTELSIPDRIKVSSHVGYNVFGTASAFWQDRIDALNAEASRRMH